MNYRAAKNFVLAKLREELSPKLTYHGLRHTMDVLKMATAICASEGIRGRALKLVKTAAVFHDAGFVIDEGHAALAEDAVAKMAGMHALRLAIDKA